MKGLLAPSLVLITLASCTAPQSPSGVSPKTQDSISAVSLAYAQTVVKGDLQASYDLLSASTKARMSYDEFAEGLQRKIGDNTKPNSHIRDAIDGIRTKWNRHKVLSYSRNDSMITTRVMLTPVSIAEVLATARRESSVATELDAALVLLESAANNDDIHVSDSRQQEAASLMLSGASELYPKYHTSDTFYRKPLYDTIRFVKDSNAWRVHLDLSQLLPNP